jgi:hypothetical protein
MLLPQALLQPAVAGKDRHLLLVNTTMRGSLCLIKDSNSFTQKSLRPRRCCNRNDDNQVDSIGDNVII